MKIRFRKHLTGTAAAALLLFPALAGAQHNPALIDPFQDDDEPRPVQQQGYNGIAEAAAALFAPPGYNPNPAVIVPQRWEDLDTVDPGGRYGATANDTVNDRVQRIVKAPLPKKKPFSDPLDDFKKDNPKALFERPGAPQY